MRYYLLENREKRSSAFVWLLSHYIRWSRIRQPALSEVGQRFPDISRTLLRAVVLNGPTRLYLLERA
jgi:hypothetical protein